MDFKEQEEIILELQGTLKELRVKYQEKKRDYQDLLKKYINLRDRYTTQNDELCRLKVLYSKEVNNDNSGS